MDRLPSATTELRADARTRLAGLPGAVTRRVCGWCARGQALVEFSLVIPILLVMLMGVIEYGFIMNGLLSIDYATRDAALIAAEAGNGAGADCVIIAKVQSEVTAPANAANIQKIQIYWTDASGQPLDTSGNPTTFGSANQAVDTYVPGGSTTCTLADSTTVTISYQLQGTATYPEDNRCNVVRGCDLLWSGVNVHHPGLDTIGVLVQYTDTWKTPLHTLIGLMGPGWSATQSNEMRMEPVL